MGMGTFQEISQLMGWENIIPKRWQPRPPKASRQKPTNKPRNFTPKKNSVELLALYELERNPTNWYGLNNRLCRVLLNKNYVILEENEPKLTDLGRMILYRTYFATAIKGTYAAP
jgi:hypothetical protein